MKRQVIVLAVWLLAVGSGALVQSRHDSLFSQPGEQRERADIILDIFGEFRTVMARYLWFKMDLYHEVLEGQGVQARKEAEVMPLLRMISLLDPSITDAYDMIAYDLDKGHGKTKEALEVIAEGLRRNPNSRVLLFRRALICYRDKQYKLAEESAGQAAEVSEDEFDILNATRLMYWSAKELKDKETMRTALDRLIAMRPNELRWQEAKADLNKP